MSFAQCPSWVVSALRDGMVIPAHPLALSDQGEFDVRRQRALTRYYHAAGAGGVAVGVHTTQFEIREPQIGLFEPVLRTAADSLNEIERMGGRKLVRICGVCGQTDQAMGEAKLGAALGYHAALLNLTAFCDATDDEMIRHCRRVAQAIPLVGFYLQAAAGGRRLSFNFWRQFAEIPNVVAIKTAPFNRYQTLDVIRGVAHSGRADQIALYTGNDDNIVSDLVSRFDVPANGRTVRLRIVGGLLGHWAVWTSKAVQVLARCNAAAANDAPVSADVLALAAQVTDCNAALFDVLNDFAGSIAGVQAVLHDQGLLASTRCLSPREVLSPGQREELDRVRRDYPHLIDDDFVAAHRTEWLS